MADFLACIYVCHFQIEHRFIQSDSTNRRACELRMEISGFITELETKLNDFLQLPNMVSKTGDSIDQ
jgi:primosomal replication protein N